MRNCESLWRTLVTICPADLALRVVALLHELLDELGHVHRRQLEVLGQAEVLGQLEVLRELQVRHFRKLECATESYQKTQGGSHK